MENHHIFMGKSTISMAIFSYVSLPEATLSKTHGSWRLSGARRVVSPLGVRWHMGRAAPPAWSGGVAVLLCEAGRLIIRNGNMISVYIIYIYTYVNKYIYIYR